MSYDINNVIFSLVSPGLTSDLCQTHWGWRHGRPCQQISNSAQGCPCSKAFGSASRSRDDVLGSSSSIRVQFPSKPISGLLDGSDSMNCGHESIHSDIGQGCQAGGSAGGIADHLEGVVLLMVHAHHKHGAISRRDRDDEPFGSTLHVRPSLLQGSEDTSGLQNIFSTSSTPFDIGRILLLENGGGLSTDDKLPLLRLDCAIELAMGGITPECVNLVVVVSEAVINGNTHFAIVKSNPGDQVPSAAKSIYYGLHHCVLGTLLELHKKMWLSVEWGGAERLNYLFRCEDKVLKLCFRKRR